MQATQKPPAPPKFLAIFLGLSCKLYSREK
jgi:hypothetical protein